MHWYMGTNYYIIEFGIRPDCQGRGLGTEFLGLIEKYILDSGISCLFLQTERNMPAYDFYRKNGFSLDPDSPSPLIFKDVPHAILRKVLKNNK